MTSLTEEHMDLEEQLLVNPADDKDDEEPPCKKSYAEWVATQPIVGDEQCCTRRRREMLVAGTAMVIVCLEWWALSQE